MAMIVMLLRRITRLKLLVALTAIDRERHDDTKWQPIVKSVHARAFFTPSYNNNERPIDRISRFQPALNVKFPLFRIE